MNFWEDKHIRLRAIEPTDAPHIIRWNKDSERARTLDFLWPPQSDASAHEWTKEKSKQALVNDAFHWIVETLDNTPVGTISTHNCDPRHGTFSYGVDIAREHRQLGYASAAIQLVLRYYFSELRYQKVTIAAHSDNPATIALHEKLGYTLEGRHRRMHFTNGQFVDVLWFGLTKEEFEVLEK